MPEGLSTIELLAEAIYRRLEPHMDERAASELAVEACKAVVSDPTVFVLTDRNKDLELRVRALRSENAELRKEKEILTGQLSLGIAEFGWMSKRDNPHV